MAAAVLALAACCTLGALVRGPRGAVGGAVAGLLAGSTLHRLLTQRQRRRRALLAEPFPAEWRRLLERWSAHYRRLPAGLRERFERDVRVFAAETRVTGIKVDVTDELRVMVAASAVTLSLGWPQFEWSAVTEVLLYPQDFGRDYSFDARELSGQAHAWGTVILSVPSLRASFAHPDDGFHVGLHEFAHVLDMEQGHFDGIPAGFAPRALPDWVEVMEAEMERLRSGPTVIDDYGADEQPEFLAVAVEAFFERPLELRRHHGRLYGLLRDYFAQDPAAWDEARRG